MSRRTVAQVSAALGHAVASRVEVAVELLTVGVDGRLGDRHEGLRGLGYVSVDPAAAEAVEQALERWASGRPFAGGSPLSPAAAVAVPAAYLAVQEYGHRLTHALDAFEAANRAQNAELWWHSTTGVVTDVGGELIRRTAPGLALSLAVDGAAILLGTDGTWDDPVDQGLRFTRDDAADEALLRWGPGTDADALARQARAAFDRTGTALGVPAPPRSPDVDLLGPFEDALADELVSRAVRGIARAARNLLQ